MKHKHTGFSLVELLVAMVITGIMFTSVTASYWLFLQSHLKAENTRLLQQEVRFAMTRITDKVRAYNLHYTEYQTGGNCGPNLNQNEVLCLQGYHFKKQGDNVLMNDQPLFSDNRVMVDSVFFDFSPAQDPLKNLANPDLQIQPKVTIYLRVKSKFYQEVQFQAQTTISSRQYRN